MTKSTELQAQLIKSIPKSSPAIHKAIIDIVAHGCTWRIASITNSVTESGILKAMQRAGLKQKRGKISKPY